jgi:hypothetical protein
VVALLRRRSQNGEAQGQTREDVGFEVGE